ncbi:MAG: hypothetical protein ACI8PZ_000043 [Myxococcota bacterium]|jgi:hypothetical protein
MKPITLVFALVSGLAFSAPALAACDGLEGKDLKKCEKTEAKKAKAEGRSEPLMPSQVDAKFAHLDADNPFATDAYSVRISKTGIEKIDAYFTNAAVLQGKVVMARYMVDNFDAMDPAQAKEAGEALAALLTSIPDDGKALIDEGKALASPDTLKSMAANPMEIPGLLKLVPALTDAVGNITSAVKEVVPVAESLKGKLGA